MKTISVKYPFFRKEFTGYDDGVDYTSIGWVPGMYASGESLHGSSIVGLCDAVGEMRLTEVGACKLPGRYAERVFYTREFITPDGKVFGKKHLRICTRGKFTKMARGYAFHYTVHARSDEQVRSKLGPAYLCSCSEIDAAHGHHAGCPIAKLNPEF